jgi:arsenate reductase
VEFLKEQAGSYEALFNRRAQLYRGRGLHEKELSDEDYKELLLDHYTFIKRPILIYHGEAFIGNSKQVVADAKVALY